AMRCASSAARAATESGAAARSSMARNAARSESAVARTARGSEPTSRRAWSRNCFASETSSGFVTRPPRGATPMAYSLAASEAAATMRRATASESIACAPAGAVMHVPNSKPTSDLQSMGAVLKRGIFNTRVILSGMQGDPSHALQHDHRHVRQVGGRVGSALAIRALIACEQELEDSSALLGDDRGDARHLHEVDADADRAQKPNHAASHAGERR